VLSACGDRGAGSDDRGNTNAAAGSDPIAPTSEGTLDARAIEAASDAIDAFLAASRTREAELVARELRARAESSALEPAEAARIAEIAARAYFARAELGRLELDPAARAALIRESAALADEAATRAAPDAVRLRFAALLADRVGDAARADTRYDEALAAARGNQAATLETLLHAASASIARKDLARARRLLDERRSSSDQDGWTDALDAECALAEANPSDAVTKARAAVARDRERVEFRLVLARALRANGSPSDAARMLGALDRRERQKPAIAEQFALSLRESGDTRAAAAAWDECLRANPADPFVRAETALAFHRAGDTARAASELAALDATPGGPAERARVERELAKRP